MSTIEVAERDCKHGQLARSCEICNLERTVADQAAEIERLKSSEIGLDRYSVKVNAENAKLRTEIERLRVENAANMSTCSGIIKGLQTSLDAALVTMLDKDREIERLQAELENAKTSAPMHNYHTAKHWNALAVERYHENNKLQAENEALRTEASKLECDYTDQVLRAMKAEEELEALRADAERYRWLRKNGTRPNFWLNGGGPYDLLKIGQSLDTAIDAAMKQGEHCANQRKDS